MSRQTRDELLAETETVAGAEDENASGDTAVSVEVAVEAEAQDSTEVTYDSTRLNREGNEQLSEDRTIR